MDVSVSHLNNRLAIQLPAQLPLGLVFVLGVVEKYGDVGNGRSDKIEFELVEKEHRVRCLLSDRVSPEIVIENGQTIRAGGHLVFDPTRADYYLLVRDVEIVPVQPLVVDPVESRAELAAVLEDVRRRAESANLAPGELPPWVEKMALAGIPIEELRAFDKHEVLVEESVVETEETVEEALERQQLAQLSAAMDDAEDVELTNNLLEVAKKLNEARGLPAVEPLTNGRASSVMGSGTAFIPDVEDPDAYTPTGKITSDRILMLVVLISLLLFFVLILVAYVRFT
jgi:hypothetical protein